MRPTDDAIEWSWEGRPVTLGLTRFGSGKALLLLPAISSISTRKEMWPLQERLGASFATVAVDWPGLGDRARPRMAWTPRAFRAFLGHLLGNVLRPSVTIAAGHAAGYAIDAAAADPASTGRLAVLSPTWRGPLPTMTGRRLAVFRWLAQAVDAPLIGHALYRANVNRPMIRMMARGHVYADPAALTPERLAEKLAVVDAPGARHASFRFVAGELDPFADRAAFLRAAERVPGLLAVYARNCPRKSRAEIDALAGLANVEGVEVPRGKLSFYEEFPDDTARALAPFCAAVA